MRRGQSVSKQQLESAARDVQRELSQLGIFEDTRLEEVDVIWCSFPQFIAPAAQGFYLSESTPFRRRLGYLEGDIYIPRWVIGEGWNQNRGSLRDILRHEYGHALAFGYPQLVRRSSRFREFFGAGHDEDEDLEDWEDRPESAFVSNYARVNPAEDFAETFMIYLRRQSRCPQTYRDRYLRRKWRFVREVVTRVRDGFSKW